MNLVCQDSDDLLPSVLDALNEVHFISYRTTYFYSVEMHTLDLTLFFVGSRYNTFGLALPEPSVDNRVKMAMVLLDWHYLTPFGY